MNEPSNPQSPPPSPPNGPVGPAPHSRGKLLWVLLLVALTQGFFCLGCGGVWWVFFRKPVIIVGISDYDRATAAPAVTSGDLMFAYQDNTDHADALYRNKLLRVAGLVINTTDDVMGRTYVALATGDINKPVVCVINPGDPIAPKLKKDDYVIIAGTCDGMTQNLSIKNAFVYKGP